VPASRRLRMPRKRPQILMLVPFALVAREQAYLERKFGDVYRGWRRQNGIIVALLHPQTRGSHHGAGGDDPNTCAVRAHDAQKLVRAKRALGAASAASKRVIDATSIRAEPSCVFAGRSSNANGLCGQNSAWILGQLLRLRSLSDTILATFAAGTLPRKRP
jgi:hypothetical protein